MPAAPFDFATPFALMCGLGVVTGYALLGATWLVMKTDGVVAARRAVPGEVAACSACWRSWRW